MIASDDYVISVQESKVQIKQRTHFDGVLRVLQAIDRQINEERQKIKAKKSGISNIGSSSGSAPASKPGTAGSIHSNGSRGSIISRRDAENARQEEIIALLLQMKDRILCTIEDAHAKLFHFHDQKNSLNRAVMVYLQRQEVCIVRQKQKWSLRVPSFTLQVMDDLFDTESDKSKRERSKEEERRIAVNSLVFICQQYCKDILSGTLIVKKDYRLDYDLFPQILRDIQLLLVSDDGDNDGKGTEENSQIDFNDFLEPDSDKLCAFPAMLYRTLELITVFCQNEFFRCKNHLQHHDLEIPRGFSTVILCCLDFIETLIQQRIGLGYFNQQNLRDGDEGKRGALALLVRMLIPQVMSAMRSMAELLVALVLNEGQAMRTAAIQKSSRPGSASKHAADFAPLAQVLSSLWHKGYKRLCDFVQTWARRLAAPMPTTTSSIRKKGEISTVDTTPQLQRIFVELRQVIASGDSTCAAEIMMTANLFVQCLLKIRDEVTRKSDRKASMAMVSAAKGRRGQLQSQDTPKDNLSSEDGTPSLSVELTLCHSLLSAALSLGARCSAAYSSLLGPQGNILALVIRDSYFFALKDSDLVAALECATTGFAIGFTDPRTVMIFTDARNILQHRYQSFLVSMSLIKCALAAAIFVMKTKESATTTAATQEDNKKDHLPTILVGLIDRLLVILSIHRYSLSICHKVLLLFRVLMRDCFMTRPAIEDVLSKQLAPLCDPWLTAEELRGNNDDDEENFGGFEEDDGECVDDTNILFLDNSVASTASQSLGLIGNSTTSQRPSVISDPRALGENSSLFKSTASALNSALLEDGSGSIPPTPQVESRQPTRGKKDEIPVEAYVKKLRPSLLSTPFFGDALPPIPITLPELILFIAENHLQTPEVIEQTLLFVEHIASKSSLIRYQLMETGLQAVISRYLDTQPDSLYVVALGEICQELLEY